MHRTALMFVALAYSGSAIAAGQPGESNDEIVTFTNDVRLFQGVEEKIGTNIFKDTAGIWATVDTSADLTFIMEGRSMLEWPEVFVNQWDQTENGGSVSITTKSEAKLKITGEILGVPLGYEVWKETIRWNRDFELRSLLLEGTRQGASVVLHAAGDSFYEIEEEFEIIDQSLSITVGGSVYPELESTLTGLSIDVDEALVTKTSETMMVAPPNENDGYVDFDATWKGEAEGNMKLIIKPWIEISVGRTTVGPFEFPIDVPIFQDTVPVASRPSDVSHDLPAARGSARTIDFGQIVLGDAETKTFTVQNLGNVELTGKSWVEGDDAFVMGQEPVLLARTNGGAPTEQDLEIDFLPIEEGSFTGTLHLETNDPINPEIVIPMAGAGIKSDDPNNGDPNDPNDDLINLPGSGCGCSTTSTSSGSMAAFGLLALLGLARRRRRS
jgi:MYXO-CTERM domain-containing protein